MNPPVNRPQTQTAVAQCAPRLPRPLAWLGSHFPARLPNRLLASLLNQLFEAPLRDGQLDWLHGKIVCVVFQDAGVHWNISTGAQGALVVRAHGPLPHVTVEGLVFDFLSLATRREDPDTLFFQRRLRLHGDMELGLLLKNFLDALETDPAQRRALTFLAWAQQVIEQTCGRRNAGLL